MVLNTLTCMGTALGSCFRAQILILIDQDLPSALNWGYMVPNSGYLGPNRG